MANKIVVLLYLATFSIASASALDTLHAPSDFKMLFKANGQVTLGLYIYGQPKYSDLNPGYRSDMLVYTDIISYKKLVFDFFMGATTRIARLPKAPIKLDKILYTLSPEFRYVFKKSLLMAGLYHECIHTISREETAGSTWWNVFQFGGGTKGAYPFYLIEKYNNRDFSLRNSFDAQVNVGFYVQGHSLLEGQNHNYRYDASGVARYHLGLFRNQTIYFDCLPHIWYDNNGKVTYKISGEINYVILALDNIATLYFNHCFHDDNPYDNENSLGAIGFKVLF